MAFMLLRPVDAYKLAMIEGKLYRVFPEDVDVLPEGSKIWKVGENLDVEVNGVRFTDPEGPYVLEFPFRLKIYYWALPRYGWSAG